MNLGHVCDLDPRGPRVSEAKGLHGLVRCGQDEVRISGLVYGSAELFHSRMSYPLNLLMERHKDLIRYLFVPAEKIIPEEL